MRRVKKFYIMQVNLDNGWTVFRCSEGSWVHKLRGSISSCPETYLEEKANEIIKRQIERDKQMFPACWQRYKYVLVEL